MELKEILSKMKEIRKKHNEKGTNYNTDINYLYLVKEKKKLLQQVITPQEIFRAKMRDLINENNNRTTGKMTMAEMIYRAKQ